MRPGRGAAPLARACAAAGRRRQGHVRVIPRIPAGAPRYGRRLFGVARPSQLGRELLRHLIDRQPGQLQPRRAGEPGDLDKHVLATRGPPRLVRAKRPHQQQRGGDHAAREVPEQQQRRRVGANYERMRANGVTITAALDPALSARLRQAGAMAVEAWASRVGADGAAILARYRSGKP